jgi:hypothetical protein
VRSARHGHAILCVGNGTIHVLDRAYTPAALVMLGGLELSAGIAQESQGPSHVGLVRPHGIQTHGRDRNDDNETNP